MSMEKFFEYLIKGALVLIGLFLAILILGPFVIGYGISPVIWRIIDEIRECFNPEQVYSPSEEDLEQMDEKIEAGKEEQEENESQYEEEESGFMIKEIEESENEEEPEDDNEEEEYFEIIYHSGFIPEKNLPHEEKEALFAQGYKRLKVSPYGNSGASYFWVKTRYNESKEHAFFCYLIETELRKYTKDIEMCTNNGPDVIVRHAGKSFCFDVETGKNLVRKPDVTKKKFLRYENDFYRSYIFVTKKALKRKYKHMGIVITRSTFRKTIADIFS